MDDIKGWKLDLQSVYGKRWRDKKRCYLTEDLWESPQGNLGALLYSIAEVGVSKEIVPL